VLGVFSDDWVEPLAHVLKQLGSEHVLVVHSEDGLDEISIAAPTRVAELKQGAVSTYEITPEQFGLARGDLAALAVDGAEQSLDIIRRAFAGEAGPARDIVALNAGAALYAAGLADSLEAGVERAGEILASGAAGQKLDDLVRLSQALGGED